MGVSTAQRHEVPEGFPALLDGFRERHDRELDAWLDRKRRQAAQEGSPEMAELIDGVGQLVGQGGKRLRPALVYHAFHACGGPPNAEVILLALATELLHTYLLIHDDIMDHAETRRGLPAAHVRFRNAHRARGFHGDAGEFGLSVAILLGDLAHTWSVELAGSASAKRPAVAACFSAMSEEVIGGQYLELLVAQRRGKGSADREAELMRVLRLKSGRYTAERPVQLGALLAGAADAVVETLSLYGSAVGEAFQLQDDLLGMFGDAGTVGKPVGDDLREGKFTFLMHHAFTGASPEQLEILESALGDPRVSAADVLLVQRILEETGARAKVGAMVEERLQAARNALAGLPDLRPEGRLFLEGLLDYLWEREL